MNKLFLYSHGGSRNHGCEAIVRGTCKILKEKEILLYSLNKQDDIIYELNNILDINDQIVQPSKYSIKRVVASLLIRLFHKRRYSETLPYVHLFNDYGIGDIGISIGGDNYCYNSYEVYEIINRGLNKNSVKTVLWGCSVEPELIDNNMAKDLAKYSLITTRESISYKAVRKVNPNTKLYPDPAFQLDKVELALPNGFFDGNTIGINISPLIISSEKNNGITMRNFITLIQYIIDTTDMQIALIPHVIWEHNDDRKPLKELFDRFSYTGRIVMIEDHNCMELKGYISRCRMFIGARTHATIAAYSTCVPTIVVGYSVKAKGIANDIFGTFDDYVIPVQALEKEDNLINAFIWLKENESKIRQHLLNLMPEYCSKALDSGKEVKELLNKLRG